MQRSIESLMEQHGGLMVAVMAREAARWHYYDRDELMSVARATFVKAAMGWDPAKGRFPTWLGVCLQNNLRCAMAKTPAPKGDEDMPEVVDRSWRRPDRALMQKERVGELTSLPGLAGEAVRVALAAAGEGMEMLGSEGRRGLRALVRAKLMLECGASEAEVREAFKLVAARLHE